MNVLRRMPNKNQRYYMSMICSGRWVFMWDEDRKQYAHVSPEYKSSDGRVFFMGIPRSKGYRMKKRTANAGGDSYYELVFEWIQRGFLVDVNGRLMPSKDVARVFGMPPELPPVPRVCKMHRTRPARDQNERPDVRQEV